MQPFGCVFFLFWFGRDDTCTVSTIDYVESAISA